MNSFWDRNIPPRVSLAAGLLLVLPFLLVRDPVARCLALIPLMIPVFVSGRPGRLIPALITFTGITLLGMFPAAGRELFRWRFVAIGSESLWRGMGRAALFCGMMLLSRMAIRPGLAGQGSFVGGIFSVFERFLTRRENFRGQDPAAALDRLLLECDEGLGNEEPLSVGGGAANRLTAAGILLLALTALFFLAALFHRYLLERITG